MDEDVPGISRKPVNVLFNPASRPKDVWEIDLVTILDMLTQILQKTGRGDLRIAGMAALSSSLIYRLKVESIFKLQKAAMEKRPVVRRPDVKIDMVDIPYRHESTYPVSLEDLLGMLENLIRSMDSPRRKRRSGIASPPPPEFGKHLVQVENTLGRYKELVLQGARRTGKAMLQEIVSEMNLLDSIRCFFAVLFLAKDGAILIEQSEDDIGITLTER